MENLLAQGKTPIICGGTGFYINSLLYKSGFGGAGADEGVRAYYESLLQEKGKEYVYQCLQEVDPESAEKLHYNDSKRVIRALEIYKVTGKKKSEQADEWVSRFPFVAVSIQHERDTLYERINRRVEIMFEQGLEDEIKALIEKGITTEHQCMQGIGYKEVLEGFAKGESIDEIKELIKKNTRNYAKRQITFFKRLENHILLNSNDATAERVLQLLK